MHFDHGAIPKAYIGYVRKKSWLLFALLSLVTGLFLISLCKGAVQLPLLDVVQTLMLEAPSRKADLIVWHIRLPQTVIAILGGAGLAVSGAVMQSVLKNPLASPFTLGISHAAAFGAALSVIIMGTGVMTSSSGDAVAISSPVLTVATAFSFSIITALIIIFIAGQKGASPHVMVLTGVALGSLFTAGTMLLQFFADDVQLSAMVFWTFGDLARADWNDIALVAPVVLALLGFFLVKSRDYNGMALGDESAKGIGIRVEWVRLSGMLAASLMTALVISFVGIISFVGLAAPHIVRRIIGDDHRFLLPASILAGALILLAADMVARLVMLPHVLPVSIFTAFLGAPVFIYLIIKGNPR